jgi:hypothetical protein
MVEDLRRAQLVDEGDDILLLVNPTNVLQQVGECLEMDLNKKRYTMQELKKMLAQTRKPTLT